MVQFNHYEMVTRLLSDSNSCPTHVTGTTTQLLQLSLHIKGRWYTLRGLDIIYFIIIYTVQFDQLFRGIYVSARVMT